MEDLTGPRFDGLGAAIKRKRSQTSRRPRPETHPFSEGRDLSPLSSLPVSDDLSKVSSDENTGDANSGGKMFNLNQCLSRGTTAYGAEVDNPYKNMDDAESGLLYNNGLGPEFDDGDNGPNGNVGITWDNTGNGNKLTKVKLKVGGVTRTIQTKTTSNVTRQVGPSTNTSRSFGPVRSRHKLIHQDNFNGEHSHSDKRSGLQGIAWKDFSRGGISIEEDMGKTAAKSSFEKSDPVRKSKRVPKRRVLDDEFDEDDEDDEIRYLEKLKTSKIVGYSYSEEEPAKKQRSLSRLSKIGKIENVDEGGRLGRDGKKSKSDRGSEDTDYEEEEMLSDSGPEGKKKKQKKDISEYSTEIKRERTLTTRQRALLSSSNASHIEFPNGLPPPPPRKQKEKLTEVEQQLKKAEAAQRRRMQNEKAARESEAEAIRKILGQDSSRKKREDKIKKRQEELAQEKAANAQMLASNTIRLVMGPSGTVVTFPQDMGLPKIFDPKHCGYPAPREKCAGPCCANPYKYRDSKSKLPLCSLQCYKAVQAKIEMESAC